MAVLNNHKLKGSTLIESLIAMIIIVLSIGISAMIYSSILSSDKEFIRLKANKLIDVEAIKTKAQKLLIDSEIKINELIIQKKISLYNETENLYCISFVATDVNGNTIATRNELIINDEN